MSPESSVRVRESCRIQSIFNYHRSKVCQNLPTKIGDLLLFSLIAQSTKREGIVCHNLQRNLFGDLVNVSIALWIAGQSFGGVFWHLLELWKFSKERAFTEENE